MSLRVCIITATCVPFSIVLRVVVYEIYYTSERVILVRTTLLNCTALRERGESLPFNVFILHPHCGGSN